MSDQLDQMSEAELADWQYAHRDEMDIEEGEPVDVDIATDLSITMSFRLSGTEADAIRQAARGAGVSLSEWIRRACAEELRTGSDDDRREQVEAALERAVEQVEVLRERLTALQRGGRRTA